MKRKKWMTAAMILVFFLLLTGCVKADFHITVNKDGSGELDYKIAMNSQLLAMSVSNSKTNMIDEMKKNFENEQFTVTTYRDGEYQGIEAKKHVSDIQTINSIAAPNATASGKLSIIQDEAFLKTTYKVNADMDMTDIKADQTDTMGLQKMMLAQMDMKFTLTLPTEAKSQNASRVLPDGKTYQWDLVPGQRNDIQLNFQKANIKHLIMICLGILIVSGTLIERVIKSKKRQTITRIN